MAAKSASKFLMFSFSSAVRSFAALASLCLPSRKSRPISFEILFISAFAESASPCSLFFWVLRSIMFETISEASKFLRFSFSTTNSGLS